jgi:hypothetical protein
MHAGVELGLDSVLIADSATHLDGQLGVRLRNAVYNLGVHRPARSGAVEINDVQTASASLDPAIGHGERVIGKYRIVVHAPLAQADAFTILEIYGRYQQHRCVVVILGITTPLQKIR